MISAYSPLPPLAAPAAGIDKTAARLVPGSEVRVSLDHIIDDALVVSFRLGEKIFSGVLMDLSKRFGPYGIPITVYPKREYKDKPESMQLKTFHPETEKGGSPGDAPDAPSKDPAQAPAELEPSPEPKPSPWTSKPPPLFHEGAPYPPPLFIRDTYNQSLPQPLPRKIKRPKRRLYREEPTSIMNAIKLRPRQVLCDKCKSAVAMGGDKRETRRGPVPDCRGDDAKRRRSDSAASVGKRPRHDHRSEEKVRGMDGAKRQAPSGGTAGSRVVRAASPANSSRVQLNAKKVLQSKNVDHSKARAVLKMAKAQQRQRDAVTGGNTKKVHFTRRLQQIGGAAPGNPLPPRMRIKPQRYRNEENDSSPCKPPCPRPVGQSLVQSEQPETAGEHGDPEAEPEEQEGREERRDTRGSKAGSLVVYMTLNPNHPDSSNTSMCSFDSADELKSSNSECSSTETFDFPPPGELRSPPTPGTSSSATSAAAPKDKKKRGRSLKATVFSKNVSKCVALDGRTICVGDIVWAKIYGFPWWPARILAIQVSRKDTGLLVRQEARVAWFGSPTTSFLALAQLAPFLENFQSRFDKKRKGLYRKAITEAAKAAKQLTPEVRALLTQFET
uniref:PWWP domain-containing protein n=1 Tax=Denticeps clupeoides TaxID=299321 RepID=A0AAY4AM10_9TELE